MRPLLLPLVCALAAPLAAQEPAAAPPQSPITALGLDASIAWTSDPEVFVDGRRPKRRLELEVDRTALLDAALREAAERRRLVLWYVPRIVDAEHRGVQMYRAPVLDLYAMQVLFNDPDVAALVGSRFVPLRMVLDEPLSARFGLRPLDFVEPAIVLLDGEGRVLHFVERLRTFDAHWFCEVLRRALDKAGAPGEPGGGPEPESALAEGRYEEAARRIEVLPASGRRHYAEAQLLRRRGEGPAALAAIAAAREAGGTAPADLDAEEIRLQLLLGRTEAAAAAEPSRDGSRAAEARYLRALAALQTGDEDRARAGFEEVARDWPGDLFGRRARANVTVGPDDRPLGAAFSGFERIGYLEPWAYRGLYRDTQWHGPELSADQIAAGGVRFLLAMQRDDGGFKDSRYAYWPSPRITPNAWIAITALAATALHEHRDLDPDRIDAAVARAETYLFDPAHLNRGDNEDVYADTYRLLYLSRRHGSADPAARARLVERMNAIVADSQARQAENGFFAHEYQNAFCTAAMLWGLRLAEGAGATVPPEMYSRGVAALVSARAENGAFAYGGTAKRRTSSIKDASTRMPLCEGMLLELGHSDPARLRAAFDAYWQHIDRIERVRRNDFHSDGELGGFFFFHALFHTSEMNRLLPDELRTEGEARILALLRRIPELDGSFVDSHEIGKSYGTAMALLTLANVRGD
jgi:hypothetical protein